MPSSRQSFAPFATLSAVPGSMPREQPSWRQFFLAPFRDIDHRAARLAAARRTERELREAAMSAAAPRQR